VWLIPVKNRIKDPATGRWGEGPKKFRPAVGRDGLLKIARNSPDFLGIKHDVVHHGDTFIVEHDTSSLEAAPKVTHRYADTFAERGPIVGAWACCYLKHRAPIFYFAPIAEHGRTRIKDTGVEWDGAWSHTSAMAIKSAVSYVLRLGLGVTGIVPVDEVNDRQDDERSIDGDPLAATEIMPPVEDAHDATLRVCRHLDPLLAENVAARVVKLGWTAARAEMMLRDCSEEDARSFAAAGNRPDGDEDPSEADVIDERETDEDVERGEDLDEREQLLAALREYEDAIADVEPGSKEHGQLLAEQDMARQALVSLDDDGQGE
jgi:hypothetical protein